MGFLHKLWDDTVAGPTPDSGLGKLRKYNSFSGNRSAAAASSPAISRSITVLCSNSGRNINAESASGSGQSSPSSCTTPTSPTSPISHVACAPEGNIKKLTRRKSTPAAHQPTGYDWIVLSALDR